jgi:hypothetical protein
MTAPEVTTAPLPRYHAHFVVLNLIAVVIAGLLAYQRLGPEPTRTWEYKIVAPPDAAFELTINQLGKHGWEIVSARRATSGEGYSATAAYELILKRPLSSGDE